MTSTVKWWEHGEAHEGRLLVPTKKPITQESFVYEQAFPEDLWEGDTVQDLRESNLISVSCCHINSEKWGSCCSG